MPLPSSLQFFSYSSLLCCACKIRHFFYYNEKKYEKITLSHIKEDLPYYKWNSIKSGNVKKINEGVVYEVTDFRDHPTYEGIVVSLDRLTGFTK